MVNLCSIASKSLHEKGKSWHESRKSWHECRFGFARIGADCRFLLARRDGYIPDMRDFQNKNSVLYTSGQVFDFRFIYLRGNRAQNGAEIIFSKDHRADVDRRVLAR